MTEARDINYDNKYQWVKFPYRLTYGTQSFQFSAIFNRHCEYVVIK